MERGALPLIVSRDQPPTWLYSPCCRYGSHSPWIYARNKVIEELNSEYGSLCSVTVSGELVGHIYKGSH